MCNVRMSYNTSLPCGGKASQVCSVRMSYNTSLPCGGKGQLSNLVVVVVYFICQES